MGLYLARRFAVLSRIPPLFELSYLIHLYFASVLQSISSVYRGRDIGEACVARALSTAVVYSTPHTSRSQYHSNRVEVYKAAAFICRVTTYADSKKFIKPGQHKALL